MDVSIEKCKGGYLIIDGYGTKILKPSLDEVFEYLMLTFEGRSKNFTGNLYGRVTIDRG